MTGLALYTILILLTCCNVVLAALLWDERQHSRRLKRRLDNAWQLYGATRGALDRAVAETDFLYGRRRVALPHALAAYQRENWEN